MLIDKRLFTPAGITACCAILLQSCTRGPLPVSPLKPELLPKTVYEIFPDRDTTIRTPGGATLQFPAGCLETKGGTTGRIFIREAYTVGEMLLGGLTTLAGSDILSAGALISIEADSSRVTGLKRPLTLALPAGAQSAGMHIWRDTGRYTSGMSWQKPIADAPAASIPVPAFGWIGSGALIKDQPGYENSQVLARFSGSEKEGISVYLILPEEKILLEGGPATAGSGTYAFYRNDGTVPLRPGAKAIVAGIKETKGGLLFAIKPFTAKASQTLQMELRPIPKDELVRTLRSIGN